MRRLPLLLAVLPLALLGAASASAQTLGAVRPGVLSERVRSAADSTQHYAVYLPAAYDTTRTWPIAFLMDPRGRALVPMRLTQEAAERYGYIVISSYNTVSDSTEQPNVVAMNAMLADAQRTLKVDRRRMYLVGFSGTARYAWYIAARLPHIAGILGVGGSGIVFSQALAGPAPRVAYYGVVGLTDFNYDEYQPFGDWLQRVRLPYRIRTFDGAHSWPPAPFVEEALAWWKLRAARDSLGTIEPAELESLLARDTAAATALEKRGERAEALARWREIARDYEGLRDVSFTAARVARLEDDPRVREQLAQRQADMVERATFNRTVQAFGEQLYSATPTPRARDAIRMFQLDALLKRAKDDDPEVAAAAQRMLEHAHTQFAFYVPRQLIDVDRGDAALVGLEVAEHAKPGTAMVSVMRARVLLSMDRADDAVNALAEAVTRGVPAAAIAADAGFAPLRDHPRFQQLTAAQR